MTIFPTQSELKRESQVMLGFQLKET